MVSSNSVMVNVPVLSMFGTPNPMTSAKFLGTTNSKAKHKSARTAPPIRNKNAVKTFGHSNGFPFISGQTWGSGSYEPKI